MGILHDEATALKHEANICQEVLLVVRSQPTKVDMKALIQMSYILLFNNIRLLKMFRSLYI